MTRRHNRVASLGALTLGLALVAGCQTPMGSGYATMRFALDRDGMAPAARTIDAALEVRHPAGGPGRMTVALNLAGLVPDAGKRQLLATVADIDRVIVTVTPSSGSEVSQTIAKAALVGGTGAVTFVGLPPVASTVTIRALDALGNEIGKSVQSITVDPVLPTTLNFTVTLNPTYVSTTGSLNTNATFVDGPVVVGPPPAGSVTPTGKVTATNTGVKGPTGLVFDAAGNGWTASLVENKLLGLKTDLTTLVLHPAARGSSPADLAFDATGGIWTANYAASSVSRIDAATGVVTKTVALPLPSPVDVEFDAAGNLYAVMHLADVIVRINPAGVINGTFPSFIPPLPVPGAPKPKTPAHLPVALKIGSDGNLWVANMKSGTVTRLSALGIPLAQIAVGKEPESLAFDAAGDVWVTNNLSGTVSKIAKANNTVTATFQVGRRPRGLTFDKQGNLWIACSTDNQVVRMSPTGVVLGRYRTTTDPRDVAMEPSTGAIWVACHGGNAVQRLQP